MLKPVDYFKFPIFKLRLQPEPPSVPGQFMVRSEFPGNVHHQSLLLFDDQETASLWRSHQVFVERIINKRGLIEALETAVAKGCDSYILNHRPGVEALDLRMIAPLLVLLKARHGDN